MRVLTSSNRGRTPAQRCGQLRPPPAAAPRAPHSRRPARTHTRKPPTSSQKAVSLHSVVSITVYVCVVYFSDEL